jgi:uncharacterized protein (TIGR02996 family)
VTDQERGLIDAIRAEPDDDGPRLVYADWLEEHGQDERAELIRVQLALEEKPKSRALNRREAEILSRRTAEWVGPLAADGVGFLRGMPAVAWWGWDAFVRGSARLARAGNPPWLIERWLSLGSANLSSADMDIIRAPGYRWLTGLQLSLEPTRSGVVARAVAAAPGSANLMRLTLFQAALGADGAEALAGSPHLGNLRRLTMYGSVLGPDGVAAIMGSTALGRVRSLNLGGAAVGDEALAALVAGRGLPRLAHLLLGGNRIGDARVRRLLKAPLLGRLRDLGMPGNVIRDGGAKALADCPALANLKGLYLNLNEIGDEGARALLDSPYLKGLGMLTLGFMPKISEPIRKRIKRRFGDVGEVQHGRSDW